MTFRLPSIFLASMPLTILSTFIAFTPAAYAYADCTFNGAPRACTVRMPWYGPGEAVPPGEDVLIIWPDGERTTVKGSGSGWKDGQQVRINGSIPGQVIRVGGRRGTGLIYIRSSSGNTFSFEFGD